MEASLLSLIINIALVFISLIWVNWDFLKHHTEFWQAIKGKDGVLQIAEIAGYVWVRALPLIVLCDLFLDYEISDKAWYSLDAIFFVIIAGGIGHKYLDNKQP
jgi:hypothetical protein